MSAPRRSEIIHISPESAIHIVGIRTTSHDDRASAKSLPPGTLVFNLRTSAFICGFNYFFPHQTV
jgi:hypothetical protein